MSLVIVRRVRRLVQSFLMSYFSSHHITASEVDSVRKSPRPATILDPAVPAGKPTAGSEAHALSEAPGPDHLMRQTGEPSVSRRAVVSVGVALAIFIYVFSIMGTAEMAPPQAIVLDDASARIFTTPACATARPANAPVLVRTTMGAAQAQGHVPEPECWRSGGFLGRSSSRMKQLLVTLRLDRGPLESRWRADGSWRW
jgi:hypothetical protein